MRLKLTLAYEGAAYAGWQIQENPGGSPTIQGEVEKALLALCGKKIRIYGAGRTDSGVHAYGQIAHFDVDDREARGALDWRKALNAHLPDDIRVTGASETSPNFHARNDALAKTYIYQFWLEKNWVPPHLRRYVWACGPINVNKVLKALDGLRGEHDFASFQNSGTPVKSTVRKILKLDFQPAPLSPFFPPLLYSLAITGTGFLKQMARNIAGYLAWTGRNKISGEQLAWILEQRDRGALGSPTAPACGLALARVYYAQSEIMRFASSGDNGNQGVFI